MPGDRGGAFGQAWTALWKAEPGRLAFALRLTLACCATTLIVQWFEIPEPALTVYLVLFLNRPERVPSIVTALVMLVFISLMILLLLPLAAALIDRPSWRVLAMTGLSFGIVFLGSASRLRPFATTMALITAYLLAMLGDAPGGEVATRGLLYAWLFVGVPAGVSVVADLIVAPSARQQAGRLLAKALGEAADLLDHPGDETRAALLATRRRASLAMPALLKLLPVEGPMTGTNAEPFCSAWPATMRILAAVDLIDRYPDPTARETIADALEPTLRGMAAILQDGGYPIAIDPPVWALSLPDGLASLTNSLSDDLASFASTATPTVKTTREGGFFAADAFTNPAHVRRGVKVTLAAMTCYILYALWDWPGIHTAMITCYVVGLGTAAETVEKLSLRIAGCLLGAALGLSAIVFVMPSVTSGLLFVIAGGMLVACWVAAGDSRISYAGFQIAFAFLLCVLQGAGPGFDLAIARDRVVGVLLGAFVSYLVFTQLWPVSVSGQIDRMIAELLDRLTNARRTPREARQALSDEAMAAKVELRRLLDLARLEPRGLRPGDTWIDSRLRLIDVADQVDPPLLLARQTGDRADRLLEDRINDLIAAKAKIATGDARS